MNIRRTSHGPGRVFRLWSRAGIRGAAGRASNGAGGAGLGLALARRLARSASGEITAEADHHGGSFLVSLPAA